MFLRFLHLCLDAVEQAAASGEQSGRAAFVIVRHCVGKPDSSAILAGCGRVFGFGFFSSTETVTAWAVGSTKSDNVIELPRKLRIVRQLECAHPG
jgi:hypothetical protein